MSHKINNVFLFLFVVQACVVLSRNEGHIMTLCQSSFSHILDMCNKNFNSKFENIRIFKAGHFFVNRLLFRKQCLMFNVSSNVFLCSCPKFKVSIFHFFLLLSICVNVNMTFISLHEKLCKLKLYIF